MSCKSFVTNHFKRRNRTSRLRSFNLYNKFIVDRFIFNIISECNVIPKTLFKSWEISFEQFIIGDTFLNMFLPASNDITVHMAILKVVIIKSVLAKLQY